MAAPRLKPSVETSPQPRKPRRDQRVEDGAQLVAVRKLCSRRYARIPSFTLLLKLKGGRLALDARPALACALKDCRNGDLDRMAFAKAPCVGLGLS